MTSSFSHENPTGRRKWWMAITCIGALLVLIGFALLRDGVPDKTSAALPQVVLARSVNPLATLAIIAEKQGFFKAQGLDVVVKEFTTGKLCFDSMLGGGADFATVAETPVVLAGFTQQTALIVATIETSPLSVKVLARRDKGISSPRDLETKRIGTFKGTSAEFFLAQFLAKNNIKKETVKITYLTPPELVTAVVNGDLDAIAIWEHYITTANSSLGNKAIVFTGEDIYTETFNITVRRDFAEKQPRAITNFLRGLIDAERFVEAHPEEARKIITEAISVPPDILKEIWPIYSFRVALDSLLVDQMKEEAAYAHEQGWSTPGASIPDYHNMVEPKFLEEIDAERVKLD